MPDSTQLLEAVQVASKRWRTAFNAGDAQGCAEQYEVDAVMEAKPFGTFEGHAAIEGFWAKLIEDGFSQIEYIDPKIDLIGEKSAVLSSGWRMNKASGVIEKELWVLQDDGSAKLRLDVFEAQA